MGWVADCHEGFTGESFDKRGREAAIAIWSVTAI
jgi:hypothetical protein